MSKYELDDELVRRVVGGRTSADDQDDLFRVLEEQLPPKEPDKEYLVKDGRDKFWRWDVRQSAWYCIQTTNLYAQWDTLLRNHGPVTIYRAVS